MVVAIPQIEKWRIVSVGKDAKGGEALISRRRSSKLVATFSG